MPKPRTRYRPVDPLQMPRFGDIATFNRLPYVPDLKGKQVDVALLGVPFDGGTSFRPGARFAPRAVREASVLCRNYNPHLAVSVYERLNIVDAGDISTNPISIEKTMRHIERRIAEVHSAGARAICVGGDHSILLPILRAMRARHGKELVMIHFDAHTDTGDTAWGERFHHGTPVRRAIEEGLVQGSRIFQIGIRGPLSSPDQDEYVARQKIHVLDMDSFCDARKKAAFFAKLRKVAQGAPCYLTFDVDGVDPAFAPGTGTPVVGGMTSFEALQSVRALDGLEIVGADVVEISPPYDHASLTSLLGAALVFEFLSLMARNPR